MPIDIMLAIADSKAGGAQKHLINLSNCLKNLGTSVIVLCPSGYLYNVLRSQNIQVIEFDFNLFCLWKLRKIVLQYRPKVINSHLLGTTFFVVVSLLLKARPKVVATLHNPIIYDGINVVKRLLFPLILKFISSRINSFIGVSKPICASIYAYAKRTAIYIPNSIPISGLSKEMNREQVKKVAIIGRLSHAKGHAYFNEAAEQVLKRYSHGVQFYVVGDGELRDDLLQDVKQRNIVKSFIFTGFINDVKSVMNQFDIVVIPSLFEGHPNYVLLETMAMGIPLIASKVGGIEEVIVHEKEGLLVPEKDSQAICDAVIRILEDEAFANELGKNARRKVEEKYNFNKNAKTYLNILME